MLVTTETPKPHSDEMFERGADLLKAMAHPLRLAVLAALLDGPRCVHELVETTGATQPLVSQHLRILRDADLLRRDRRGREAIYAITDDHIHHIVIDAVDHVRTEGPHDDPHLHEA